MSAMELFVVGLNHRTAPVELRERLAVNIGRLPEVIGALRSRLGLEEAVVLSTCNRFEVYGVAREGEAGAERIFRTVADGGRPDLSDSGLLASCAYARRREDCVQHLFRVASSMDSLVVGETEIVGQVKTAYQAAYGCGGTGRVLNRLFQKALFVSKEVRSQSGIGRCSTSVGSVAVDLAAQIFGENLRSRTVLIIGAGKISETILRHLAKRGAESILVSNRSYDRAQVLAGEFNGRAHRLDELAALLPRADIVISSTSAPSYVLRRDDFAEAIRSRGCRPLFLIDLAVPRDIDPAVEELEGVYLYNVDQLARLARENLQLRQAEAAACEQLILNHARTFASRLWLPDVPRVRPSPPRSWPAFTPAAVRPLGC